jgi:hypothetical protein
LSYAPTKLVAVAGIEPTSLDYQSSALAVELHREVVDPTGLKPAPHGLKGRRSVARAPGQKNWLWRKGSNLRIAALTVRCLTNLATPQKTESGCGDETRTRTPSFTRRVLCYPIELRRNLVDWEGFKPSQEVCRTSMLSVTSPARNLVAVGGVEPPTSRL